MPDIQITWPDLGEHVHATLDDDAAPEVNEAIRSKLPFESFQVHALVTGELLFNVIPVYAYPHAWTDGNEDNVEYLSEVEVGSLCFDPAAQRLLISYGELTEPEGTPVIGRVEQEDLDILKSVGSQTWENLTSPVDKRTPLTVEYTKPER